MEVLTDLLSILELLLCVDVTAMLYNLLLSSSLIVYLAIGPPTVSG